MNIIYLHTHDLGRYIGPYGYTPRTPNLQRLADEGVLFRNAFCVAPTCSPSRAALVTGKYPHQVGMHGLTNQGWGLRDYNEHFARHFSDHGMHTALTGIQHITGPTPEELAKLPYHRFIEPIGEPGETGEDLTTLAAIDFLKEKHDNPFFLNVGHSLTHHSNWDRSFVLSRETMGPLDTRYVRPLPHLPDTPRTRWEAAMQFRAAEYFDSRVGLLLDALDETGLAGNTLVVFTTDHGPGLPGVKTHLNDRGLGVATIIRGPGGFSGGRVVEGLTSHMDLFPTFCDLLEIDPPGGLEGKSLLPMVNGDTEATIHDRLFSEQGYHGRYLPLRSVRTERYRYIRRYGEPQSALLYFNADQGEVYKVLEAAGCESDLMPDEQLFDLHRDPQELVNLATNSEYRPVLDNLRQSLDAHLARTGDPALDDAIPGPPPPPDWATEKTDAIQNRVRMWREKRIAIQREDSKRFPIHLLEANGL